MKRYSIFHVPVLSFFSRSLYRDVCARWKGTGFAYLLLLLAVCWIPPIVKTHKDLSSYIDNEAPKIVNQIPDFSIVDGVASMEESQPYFIRDPETGQTIVAIDTTGTITSLADTDARGLITRTDATFKKNEFETRTFTFGKIKEFTLDQAKITSWLATAKKFVAPALYPLALLGSFSVRIIQVLLYAAVGILFSSWCKSKRTYVELLRLSVVALTPIIIIKTILGIAQVGVPLAGLWYFLAAMGYLFFGIKTASLEEGPANAPPLPHAPSDG